MSDVTFGVKVSEEMKGELSQLMKQHELSGKEFMSMLLASYKLDQTREKKELLAGDIIELQNLTKRIYHLFINMVEKSELVVEEECETLNKVIEGKQLENSKATELIEGLREEIKAYQDREGAYQKREEALREEQLNIQKELELNKGQLQNNLLLHHKFEDEIEQLKNEINNYKRLDMEIKECHDKNTQLKNKNDDLASEVWFLQREVEKLQLEKEQLMNRHAEEKSNLEVRTVLTHKNELLEQQLKWQGITTQLQTEIIKYKDEISQFQMKEKENKQETK